MITITTCDGCGIEYTMDYMTELGDEHNVYLVLCHDCHKPQTKKPKESRDRLGEALDEEWFRQLANESLTSDKVRTRLQLGLDNELPF